MITTGSLQQYITEFANNLSAAALRRIRLSVTGDTSEDDERSERGPDAPNLLFITDRDALSVSFSNASDRAEPRLPVRTVGRSSDARTALEDGRIDAVVSEYRLRGTDGLSLFTELRAVDPDVPFVLYPRTHCDRTATAAIDAGVTEYLPQSADTGGHDVLIHAVRRAIRHQRTVERSHRHEAERKRFERAVEAAGHAVFITGPDGTIEYVNPAFERITGYDAATAIGASPRILKSGEMSDEYYETLWETIRSGAIWSEPIINRRRSGDRYHADETIAPIADDDGMIEGFVAIQTDITERVETREELEMFERIVQRVDDPIMIQDADGRFELTNDAVGEYAGVETDDLLGTDEFAFMNATAAEAIAERKRQVMQTEQAATYEVTPTFPDDERSFVTTRYPKRDEHGAVDGTVAICRDVTEQLERERQLRVLVRILRHNINNKMSVILGNAGLLADRLSEDEADPADRIRETGEELVELAETKRRIIQLLVEPPEPTPITLAPALDRIAEDVRRRLPESSITVRCPDGLAVEAVPQLREALEELIENAAIHAERSDPAIDVRVDPDPTTGVVVVAIADNGPGIPAVEREVLSASAELSQTRHGRGLGLRFADQVSKASNGSLDIRNEPEGAVVELRLPHASSALGPDE